MVIAIIALGTLLSWYRVLDQSLIGEGYYYLFHGLNYGSLTGTLSGMLHSYEAGAKLLYDIFRTVFRDNIFLYQFFLLASVSVINILFYLFVFVLTEAWLVAFIASILFSVNFVGFEMFAIGNYQFFAQRTLAFLFLFPSVSLFILYLRKNQFVYYVMSVFLYFLAFFLFHFTLFFLPYFLCVIAMFLKPKWNVQTILRGMLIGLPFVLISLVILRFGNDPVSRDVTVMSFLRDFGGQIPSVMMKHFSILTVPETVLSYVIHIWKVPHGEAAVRLFYPVAGLYAAALLFLYRTNKKLFPVAMWSLVFLGPTFFVGLFTRWDMTANLGSGSRYLYVPTVAFAVYWGVVLATVGKKYLGLFGLVLVMGTWSVMQFSSLSKTFAVEEEKHIAMKISMQYVKELSTRLESDAIVIVPSPMGYYGGYFAQLFYGKEHTSFVPFFADWANELPRPFDPEKDVILDYDRVNQKVVDKTADYQAIIAARTNNSR